MNCEEATKLMDGYLDGELDPMTSQKIEQHLRDCRKCEQAYKAHTALTHAISRGAPYYKAPIDLRQRVHSSLRDEVDEKPARNVPRGSQLLVHKKAARATSRSFRDTVELVRPRRSCRFGRDHRFPVSCLDYDSLLPTSSLRHNL